MALIGRVAQKRAKQSPTRTLCASGGGTLTRMESTASFRGERGVFLSAAKQVAMPTRRRAHAHAHKTRKQQQLARAQRETISRLIVFIASLQEQQRLLRAFASLFGRPKSIGRNCCAQSSCARAGGSSRRRQPNAGGTIGAPPTATSRLRSGRRVARLRLRRRPRPAPQICFRPRNWLPRGAPRPLGGRVCAANLALRRGRKLAPRLDPVRTAPAGGRESRRRSFPRS